MSTESYIRGILVCCSSPCFPFVGARLVTCHSAVWLLSLFFSIAPCCPFLSTFLLTISFLYLSSHNSPILAVVFLVFCEYLMICQRHRCEY